MVLTEHTWAESPPRSLTGRSPQRCSPETGTEDLARQQEQQLKLPI